MWASASEGTRADFFHRRFSRAARVRINTGLYRLPKNSTYDAVLKGGSFSRPGRAAPFNAALALRARRRESPLIRVLLLILRRLQPFGLMQLAFSIRSPAQVSIGLSQ